MSSEHPTIILYQYQFSPFAKRVDWYLQLRGIPYKRTEQSPILPRPDITALGINYRRIPILSIGRDVYLDTRLILSKLEEQFAPSATVGPRLGALDGEHRALERLLETVVVEAGPFLWSVLLMPAASPVFKDERFLKDRDGFFPGAKFGPPSATTRAEAAANLSGLFELLETALLADGRDWLLKTEGPSLADIEAVWPLHWIRGMPGAVPEDVLGKQKYPKVWAWVERFDQSVKAAAAKLGKIPTIEGAEATKTIVGSPYLEKDGHVESSDPVVQALSLKLGDRVVVYPTDTGMSHKDTGSLVSLQAKEVVFETKAQVEGSPAIRVHAPRHGFRVAREDQASHL